MALLSPMTRERLDPALHALWDECAKSYAAFENLWATMANSPTIFRHVWGQLLELKRDSPVAARHFEIGIVVVSALHRCHYCVSHHAPLARVAGLDAGQVAALAGLTLGPLAEDHDFPLRPGFTPDDSLVVDWAYFLVWASIYPHVLPVPPRTVHALRRRLHARLADRLSPREIEELTWRICQCAAFNWHNEALELDLEPGVSAVSPAP